MLRKLQAFFSRPGIWLLCSFIMFFYEQCAEPALNLWKENWLIEHKAAKGPPPGMINGIQDWLATWLLPWLSYLTGPFGLGFLIGGAVFAVPDVLGSLRRWRSRRLRTLDDGLLRDLQGLLEVWLRDAVQALASAISFVIHDARLKGSSQLGVVPHPTQDGLHGRLHVPYQRAQSDLSVAVAAGSLNDAQEAVRQCLLACHGSQKYVGALGSHLGVDLDVNGAVAEWLEADRECVMRLRELVAPPRLRGLRRLAEGIEPASSATAWRDGF